MGLAAVVAAIRPTCKFIIAETGITCPLNPFACNVTIPFSEMSEVSLKSAGAGDYIEIRHSGGKVSIPSSFLPCGTLTHLRDALDDYRRQSAATSQGPGPAGSGSGSHAGV